VPILEVGRRLSLLRIVTSPVLELLSRSRLYHEHDSRPFGGHLRRRL
jgi:hypothetical protein